MDALQALLSAKPIKELTDTVHIERLGTDFTVKALTMSDVSQLREEATYMKDGKLAVNEEQLGLLMIVKATVSPDFKDKTLMAHFEAKTATQCVQNALLAAEFNALTQAVVKVGGLAPATAKEIDDTKN